MLHQPDFGQCRWNTSCDAYAQLANGGQSQGCDISVPFIWTGPGCATMLTVLLKCVGMLPV